MRRYFVDSKNQYDCVPHGEEKFMLTIKHQDLNTFLRDPNINITTAEESYKYFKDVELPFELLISSSDGAFTETFLVTEVKTLWTYQAEDEKHVIIETLIVVGIFLKQIVSRCQDITVIPDIILQSVIKLTDTSVVLAINSPYLSNSDKLVASIYEKYQLFSYGGILYHFMLPTHESILNVVRTIGLRYPSDGEGYQTALMKTYALASTVIPYKNADIEEFDHFLTQMMTAAYTP